tara:strand:- start:7931 stop:8299 length:369 start_codon:yes stop_codon:yes gene_type:complete
MFIDHLMIVSAAIAKPFSHQVVALTLALSVQMFHPDSRTTKATLAITITALVVGYLTYLLGEDTSIASYATHTLAALGGGLVSSFLSQMILVNDKISSDEKLAESITKRLTDKVKQKRKTKI